MKYAKRSRFRRATKWMGLIFCALVVAAWGLSLFSCFGYVGATGIRYVGHGQVYITYLENGSQADLGWVFRREDFSCSWLPAHRVDWLHASWPLARWWIPLWTPFLAVALPTAWFCHRDRRPPRGYCAGCSYNLTGNVSGTCPECGMEFER